MPTVSYASVPTEKGKEQAADGTHLHDTFLLALTYVHKRE
jgi:hypothetical protein